MVIFWILQLSHLGRKESLRYIICCAMDPFATSMDFIEEFGNIMRNAILCSIGTVS